MFTSAIIKRKIETNIRNNITDLNIKPQQKQKPGKTKIELQKNIYPIDLEIGKTNTRELKNEGIFYQVFKQRRHRETTN